MTPEQERAHNMLTYTLWPEWEERCRRIAAKSDVFMLERAWERRVIAAFGCSGKWHVNIAHFMHSDYEVAGEYYKWIP